MCGIFGAIGVSNANLATAKKALGSLKHRGPDQSGDYFDSGNGVYLGHRRLSIIDLSENGRQPMTNTDATVFITVNGEIYNFVGLRKELERKHSFTSNSDSEVIIHGYIEWGLDGLLNRLEGMYAFVLYDATVGKLFLIRDRVGIKPLYYSTHKGRISWSSEIGAIEEYIGKSNLSVDYTALYDFLTYQYIPAPKSLYHGVYKLPPAHYAEIDLSSNSISIEKYWSLKTDNLYLDLDKAVVQLKGLIADSVKQQLVADVPVGFFLSGGIDSSILVQEASKITDKINTFTIGFKDSNRNESSTAEETAKRLGTNHTTKYIKSSDVAKNFELIKPWYGEPFADTSAFPTHLVSELAAQNVTVAISGDGGDEIFSGYKWYDELKGLLDKRTVFTKLLHSISKNHETEWILYHYTKLMGGLTKSQKKQYAEQWGIDFHYDDYWYFRRHYKPELSFYKRYQYLDFHTYLPDDILTKVDRVSMREGLEVRVPLLDTNIIEFVFSLSDELVRSGGKPKGLVKLAYKDELPESLINKPKQGFSIPVGEWKAKIFPGYKYKQEAILNILFAEHVVKK